MNRSTIIGLVLILAVTIIYSIWVAPNKKEIEARRRIQDSLIQVQKATADSLQMVTAREEAAAARRKKIRDSLAAVNRQGSAPTAQLQERRNELGPFSNASFGKDETFYVENGLYRIGISSQGGKIISVDLRKYRTWDSLPLILFNKDSVDFGLSFFADNRLINTNELYFSLYAPGHTYTPGQTITVPGNDSLNLSFRLYTNSGDSGFNPDRYIEYVYHFSGSDYMIGYTVNIVGLEDILASNTNSLNLSWHAELYRLEKSVDRFNGTTIYYRYYNDEVKYLSETKDDQKALTTRVKWISFKQRFFCSTFIAGDYFNNADVRVFTDQSKSDRYNRSAWAEIGIPYSRASIQSVPMRFYFGPLKYNLIRKYHLALEHQIPLGWSFFLLAWINRYAVIPVFDFLSRFGWNYGIIILVLTILLKIVLLPIAFKTYTSTAKMRVLKPEIDEISKKFPKKEDAMKKQQAVMALYKQVGVNPMSGCIPMLLQFPILVALFRFFPSSIELRQQPFLWAHDLSSYDSILNLPFNIPFYGNHVSLFCLLMTISTIIYTRINDKMMSTGQQQVPGMKVMMYMMPVLFLGFFNSYAAALSYYYFLANIFTFLQMFLFRRFVNEEKIHQRLQENRKKPVKKSGFQKRLEEMAKSRGYTPRR